MPARASTRKSKPKPRKGLSPRAVRLVFADERGNLYDHPSLEALVPFGRHGARRAAASEFRVAPSNGVSSNIAMLPGRAPVGLDPAIGKIEAFDSIVIDGKRVKT